MGSGLQIDHRDGDASNNDPANLRVHCPPCEAIRHCGLAAVKEWVVLAKSDMNQVEIIRRTRKLFEESGSMPNIREIDASATRPRIETTELANRFLEVDLDDLTEEKGLRGFFTPHAENLFIRTMVIQ
jgi:hypothetical protein